MIGSIFPIYPLELILLDSLHIPIYICYTPKDRGNSPIVRRDGGRVAALAARDLTDNQNGG